MDFDIGNILYVVITLVAIIASLLGKKKKPADKNAKPGFFENLEQVLQMGKEDPEIMDLRPHEPDLQKEYDLDDESQEEVYNAASESLSFDEESGIMQPDYSTSSLESVRTEGQMATEPMEVIQLDEFYDREDPDYFEIVKDFDAGTAVVYSAIINRVIY